jgi:hypothetical protein
VEAYQMLFSIYSSCVFLFGPESDQLVSNQS